VNEQDGMDWNGNLDELSCIGVFLALLGSVWLLQLLCLLSRLHKYFSIHDATNTKIRNYTNQHSSLSIIGYICENSK
jgi:hypothetical protein